MIANLQIYAETALYFGKGPILGGVIAILFIMILGLFARVHSPVTSGVHRHY
jgi:uncharacterized membrane protein YgaE (UPF0421/DUF939 family)